jgi:agmatine/peptidylarginine deiminase
MKTFKILWLFLILPSFLLAQKDPNISFSYLKNHADTLTQAFFIDAITDPPAEPVRAMAEWEEIGAIALTYDLTGFSESKKVLLAEIIRHAQSRVEVIVFCYGDLVFNIIGRVKNDLTRRGVPLENLTFVETDFNNRIWIRDFGAHCAYFNDVESLVLVDWKYEPQYQNADIKVSEAMGVVLEAPVYTTSLQPYDLKLDGGNFLTDGCGMAFSSTHVLDDNSYSSGEIDLILDDFMGIDLYPKLPKLTFDVTHHVDMHMKLLDEETLLVGQYPEGVADGPQIEENVDWFVKNIKTTFGTDYKVERIIMPPDKFGNYPDSSNNCSLNLGLGCYYTYTNALFINDLILVPIYFEGAGSDQEALETWKRLMPGYEVVGIDCREIIREYGAIHCVTKEIGVAKPLRLVHQKVEHVCADKEFYPIKIKAQHASGVRNVNLFYKNKNATSFEFLEMVSVDGENFLGELPKASFGDTIQYYFEAQALDGKQITKPYPGPEGPYQIAVDCQTSSLFSPGQENEPQFMVYPNPGSEILFKWKENVSFENCTYQVYDLNGRLLEVGILNRQEGVLVKKGSLPPGMYILKIETESSNLIQKLIID